MMARKIAEGCQEVFYTHFKKNIIPDDASFFAFEKGLDVEGEKPDYVLTLGQKQGKMKIPLMIFHEKIPVEHLNDSTLQLSKYAKKILEEDFEINNQKFELERVYIVLIFPKTLEYRFVKFKRPGKNQTLADVVEYTEQCPLSENKTNMVDTESLNNLLKVLFNCIFFQLSTLNLFDEKSLQKSGDQVLLSGKENQ